jgi:prepilin-type N-terminal cleavage/methylation domain-containing protein
MKNGFTIIELLAVIVLIAIISFLTVPNITSYFVKSKEDLYVSQTEKIEEAAKEWSLDNSNLIDEVYYLEPSVLIEEKYLDGDLKDPRTGNNMNGCIVISYDTMYKQYKYEYKENTCKVLSKN